MLTFKTMMHIDKHAVNSESLVEEMEEGLYIGRVKGHNRATHRDSGPEFLRNHGCWTNS